MTNTHPAVKRLMRVLRANKKAALLPKLVYAHASATFALAAERDDLFCAQMVVAQRLANSISEEVLSLNAGDGIPDVEAMSFFVNRLLDDGRFALDSSELPKDSEMELRHLEFMLPVCFMVYAIERNRGLLVARGAYHYRDAAHQRNLAAAIRDVANALRGTALDPTSLLAAARAVALSQCDLILGV